MAETTAIEWADATANFWEGCTQISPACDHCYAKARAERFGSVEWNGPPRKVEAGRKVARAMQRQAEATGETPLVFVNSLSDFFDKNAPDAWRSEALTDIAIASECIFLLLTKRIGNVEPMLDKLCLRAWPRNAWLGITVVNQEEADRDIPKLLAAKAALRIPKVFLSIEPMLGPIDLCNLNTYPDLATTLYGVNQGAAKLDALHGWTKGAGHGYRMRDVPAVDWVICGGESGPSARVMRSEWARSLRDQCADAGVPFLFKQWGEWAPWPEWPADRSETTPPIMELRRVGKARAGRLLDGVEHNARPPLSAAEGEARLLATTASPGRPA